MAVCQNLRHLYNISLLWLYKSVKGKLHHLYFYALPIELSLYAAPVFVDLQSQPLPAGLGLTSSYVPSSHL